MIHGVGTDIAAVARLRGLWERHGERAVERILAPQEIAEFARFLAQRFAAKEAFSKALGTGIRPPATLPAIAIGHDDLGKPILTFSPALAALLEEKHLIAHLSISDEADYAVAYVILEQA